MTKYHNIVVLVSEEEDGPIKEMEAVVSIEVEEWMNKQDIANAIGERAVQWASERGHRYESWEE